MQITIVTTLVWDGFFKERMEIQIASERDEKGRKYGWAFDKKGHAYLVTYNGIWRVQLCYI